MMRSINICIKYESCLRLIEEYPTGIRTKDMIYMYEATHSNVVPNDEVPESYIDASLCSVLPVDPGEPDEGDIGAKNGCNGYTLTLSFHAKEEKEIKCYLFWSGQMIRFMPEDMKTLLPSIFNMEFTG
eukprot:874339_1